MGNTRRSFSERVRARERMSKWVAYSSARWLVRAIANVRKKSDKHDYRDGERPREKYLKRSTEHNNRGAGWNESSKWSKSLWTKQERRSVKKTLRKDQEP